VFPQGNALNIVFAILEQNGATSLAQVSYELAWLTTFDLLLLKIFSLEFFGVFFDLRGMATVRFYSMAYNSLFSIYLMIWRGSQDHFLIIRLVVTCFVSVFVFWHDVLYLRHFETFVLYFKVLRCDNVVWWQRLVLLPFIS
jgi:hypothetical protein